MSDDELKESLQHLADGTWRSFADDPEIMLTAKEALRRLFPEGDKPRE